MQKIKYFACIYHAVFIMLAYEPYFFSNHTTLPASDPLRFRKNFFQSYKNASSS